MDGELLILLIIFAVTTVVPWVFKQFTKKENVSQNSSARKENPSVIEKISGQIQLFFKELEEQTRPKESHSDEEEDIWSQLGREEANTIQDNTEASDQSTFEPPPVPQSMASSTQTRDMDGRLTQGVAALAEELRTAVPLGTQGSNERPAPKEQPGSASDDGIYGLEISGQNRARTFSPDHLQNAVIWAEVLNKPLALREE